VDVVLDMVGGDYVGREMGMLAEGGRIVFIAFLGGRKAEFDIQRMMMRCLTLTGATLRARPVAFKGAVAEALRRHVWPLIEAGAIRPVIDRVFALDEAADAHRRLASGAQVGKILLRISDEEYAA
jgi:NADPH2:quinone reductase